MLTGTIFDLVKYSIHDGPGIRTTVFLKGCPLTCHWCHNPESQKMVPEIMLRAGRCIKCGDCFTVCSNKAISGVSGKLRTTGSKCMTCGKCVAVCSTGAREIAGRRITVKETMQEIEKDAIFYGESGGGVTFSGGEPFSQPEFLYALLVSCKDKGFHTAVDTAGFVETEVLLRVGREVDLFLYDLKIMDDKMHKKYTGVSNELILKNLQELATFHENINVRFPLIPSINDDDENIAQTCEFVASLKGMVNISILPYHSTGVGKYKRLKRENKFSQPGTPSAEKINRIKEKLAKYGLKVTIGG